MCEGDVVSKKNFPIPRWREQPSYPSASRAGVARHLLYKLAHEDGWVGRQLAEWENISPVNVLAQIRRVQGDGYEVRRVPVNARKLMAMLDGLLQPSKPEIMHDPDWFVGDC
jgi:biotin operon repressor